MKLKKNAAALIDSVPYIVIYNLSWDATEGWHLSLENSAAGRAGNREVIIEISGGERSGMWVGQASG